MVGVLSNRTVRGRAAIVGPWVVEEAVGLLLILSWTDAFRRKTFLRIGSAGLKAEGCGWDVSLVPLVHVLQRAVDPNRLERPD